jgi:hypothetical protein
MRRPILVSVLVVSSCIIGGYGSGAASSNNSASSRSSPRRGSDESHQIANDSSRPYWERARSFNRNGATLIPDRETLAGGDVRFSAVAVARYCPGPSTASNWK